MFSIFLLKKLINEKSFSCYTVYWLFRDFSEFLTKQAKGNQN